jgi:hypothetical protein
LHFSVLEEDGVTGGVTNLSLQIGSSRHRIAREESSCFIVQSSILFRKSAVPLSSAPSESGYHRDLPDPNPENIRPTNQSASRIYFVIVSQLQR